MSCTPPRSVRSVGHQAPGRRAGAPAPAPRGGRRATASSAGTLRAGSRSRPAPPGCRSSARRTRASLRLSEPRSSIGSHWNGVHGFGTNGLIETRMRPTRGRPFACQQARAHRLHQVGDGIDVRVGLGRQPDHEVELQRLDAPADQPLGGAQDVGLGEVLVDHAAHALRAGLGRDRDATGCRRRPSACASARRDEVGLERRRRRAAARRRDLRQSAAIARHARHLGADQADRRAARAGRARCRRAARSGLR